MATSLFNKAVSLIRREELDQATATYQQLIDSYGDDPDPALRELVAKAQSNRRGMLSNRNRQTRSRRSFFATEPDLAQAIRTTKVTALRDANRKRVRRVVGRPRISPRAPTSARADRPRFCADGKSMTRRQRKRRENGLR